MSSESSAKPGRYAPHYLAPKPKMSDEDWLMTLIEPKPDWYVLDLSGRVAVILVPQVRQVVDAVDLSMDAAHLPFTRSQFDLVIYQHQAVAALMADLFDIVREVVRILRPGGHLIVQDLGLPENERAAHYVDAFFRFRESSQRRSHAVYEWQGLMLDAGLQIARTDTTTRPLHLQAWAADCSSYVTERLHILLHQAPAAVADFLRPFAIGSPDAMFTQTLVTVIGQKPLV